MSEIKVRKANPAVEYIQESYLEMKKVTWPTRNQAIRLTLLVLGFCVAAAIVIGAMDAAFSYGHQALINYAATVNPQEITDTSAATTAPLTGATATAIPVSGGVTTTVPITDNTTPAATAPVSGPVKQ